MFPLIIVLFVLIKREILVKSIIFKTHNIFIAPMQYIIRILYNGQTWHPVYKQILPRLTMDYRPEINEKHKNISQAQRSSGLNQAQSRWFILAQGELRSAQPQLCCTTVKIKVAPGKSFV
jgi:hypothetical protein